MNMSPEQENFEALRRLLALKRHEQPPPGYFNHFSIQVIRRIQAGERVPDSLLERLFMEAPWFQRMWGILEAKPVLVGAFGAAVCGLMLAGLVYSENVNVAAAPVLLPPPDPQEPTPTQLVESSPVTPMFSRMEGVGLSNTGGIATIESRPSLFQEFNPYQRPWVVPASYTAPAKP
jgi:hypothetical protein